MSDFKEIKTQEEFDAAIKERLERERAKFSDYEELKKNNTDYQNRLSSVQSQLQQFTEEKTSFETQIAELNSKIKSYETDSVKTRIALGCGLPLELAGRLTGETEEDIKADAEKLARMMKPQHTAPTKAPEQPAGDNIEAAYKSLLSNFNE